jgi:hypothetical protein
MFSLTATTWQPATTSPAQRLRKEETNIKGMFAAHLEAAIAPDYETPAP